MGVFILTDAAMRRLFALNDFAVEPGGVILFGLRGCLPLNEKAYEALPERQLETVQTDNRHPRCTIGVWQHDRGLVAAYPGSTVPYAASIATGVGKDGKGVNQLVPSFVQFKRGLHPGSDTKPQHPAFRQAMDFAVQRTGDDAVYEADDRWVIDSSMGDNLHCGRSQGSHQPYFSSFGCQVVCGTARYSMTPGSSDSGAWPAFRDLSYGDGNQNDFRYALLSGKLAQAAALEPDGTLPKMLRYGSTGDLVSRMQAGLKTAGYATASQPGRFGRGTLLAVRRFQQDHGLPPDGVVGPDTAALLDMADWPRI